MKKWRLTHPSCGDLLRCYERAARRAHEARKAGLHKYNPVGWEKLADVRKQARQALRACERDLRRRGISWKGWD